MPTFPFSMTTWFVFFCPFVFAFPYVFTLWGVKTSPILSTKPFILTHWIVLACPFSLTFYSGFAYRFMFAFPFGSTLDLILTLWIVWASVSTLFYISTLVTVSAIPLLTNPIAVDNAIFISLSYETDNLNNLRGTNFFFKKKEHEISSTIYLFFNVIIRRPTHLF